MAVDARIGIGRMSAGGSKKTQTIKDTTYKLEISRSSTFLNPGISAGYRTSNLCSIILDVSYRCPLQSCNTIYTVTEPDLPSVTETVKSVHGQTISAFLWAFNYIWD